MKRFGILMGILFFMINTRTSAQQLSLKPLSFLGLGTNLGGAYYYNGGGFELGYQQDVWKGRVIGGLEYRMVSWGNQVGINLGYNMPFWTKGQWRASVSGQTQFSWALFHQKSLLVWGIECVPEIEWHSNKAFFVSLGVGVRYTNCPAYQNYGDISKLIDLPIKIGVGFYLNNKKRQQ